jgi:hypothetical protein
MRSPFVNPSFGKNTLPRLDTSRVVPRPSVNVPLPPSSSKRSSWATTPADPVFREGAFADALRAVVDALPDVFADALDEVAIVEGPRPFLAADVVALRLRAAARAPVGASADRRRTAPERPDFRPDFFADPFFAFDVRPAAGEDSSPFREATDRPAILSGSRPTSWASLSSRVPR